jgi:hypothetical protein
MIAQGHVDQAPALKAQYLKITKKARRLPVPAFTVLFYGWLTFL